MPTKEIPQKEWNDFFTSFSRVHDGWLSALEVTSPSLGALVEARNLCFAGISKAGPRDTSLRIFLGDERGAHLSHSVDAPARVRVQQTDEGADEALEIESTNEMKTRLTFRVAAMSDTVDGLR